MSTSLIELHNSLINSICRAYDSPHYTLELVEDNSRFGRILCLRVSQGVAGHYKAFHMLAMTLFYNGSF